MFPLFPLIVFLNLILNSIVVINTESTVSVTLKNGVINGKIESSLEGKPMNVFRGIPYAEPPINQLRFRKPRPVKSWHTKPIDAFEFSSNCIQNKGYLDSFYGFTNFSEDCLYLNIWSPNDSQFSDNVKPVIVWIHGGALHKGSASEPMTQGMELAARGDVVVLSMNYRLNVFGFLFTGTDDAPGNVGLWDQALALEWVNENIRYFGGDPNHVTIMGLSAGGWSVSLHVLSPVSRSLFRNAVINSGAYVNSVLNGNNEEHVKRWLLGAEAIGCVGDERNQSQSQRRFSSKIVECLRGAKSEQLLQMTNSPHLMSGSIKLYHLVVVDGVFLPSPPSDMLKGGDFKRNVNLMVSTVEDEGSFILQTLLDYNKFHPNLPQKLKHIEAYNELRTISSQIQSQEPIDGEEVAKLYFTGLSESSLDFDLLRRTIGIAVGDYYLTCPTLEFAKQVFINSDRKANVFQYLYNSKSQEFLLCSKWMGVCHANDLVPMFGNSFGDNEKYSKRDREISTQMMTFLTDFAKKDEPTPQNGAQWPKYYTIDDNIIAPYYEITYEPKINTNFGHGFKINECNHLWRKYLHLSVD